MKKSIITDTESVEIVSAPEIEIVVEAPVTGTIYVRCRETGFEVHMPVSQWNAYGDQERDRYLVISG